jgi:hypothetical protein
LRRRRGRDRSRSCLCWCWLRRRCFSFFDCAEPIKFLFCFSSSESTKCILFEITTQYFN